MGEQILYHQIFGSIIVNKPIPIAQNISDFGRPSMAERKSRGVSKNENKLNVLFKDHNSYSQTREYTNALVQSPSISNLKIVILPV